MDGVGLWVIPALMVLFFGFLWCLQFIWGVTQGRPTKVGFVTGVVGLRGQGKSVFAMSQVLQYLKRGGFVVCNFDIKGYPGQTARFEGWTSLAELLVERAIKGEKTIVVMDEAHIYAPASGQVFPKLANWVMSMLRKFNAEFMWITQHEKRVASGLRDQTNEMVGVKKLTRHWFRARVYEPEAFRKHDAQPLYTLRYRLSQKVMDSFDSWEIIMPDEDTDELGLISDLVARLRAGGVSAEPAPDGSASTIPDEWADFDNAFSSTD